MAAGRPAAMSRTASCWAPNAPQRAKKIGRASAQCQAASFQMRFMGSHSLVLMGQGSSGSARKAESSQSSPQACPRQDCRAWVSSSARTWQAPVSRS